MRVRAIHSMVAQPPVKTSVTTEGSTREIADSQDCALTKKCIFWMTETPPVIELSRYVLEALRKDEEFILYRGRSQDDPSQVLVLSPVAEYLRPESLKRLEHAYSLKEELDPA